MRDESSSSWAVVEVGFMCFEMTLGASFGRRLFLPRYISARIILWFSTLMRYISARTILESSSR